MGTWKFRLLYNRQGASGLHLHQLWPWLVCCRAQHFVSGMMHLHWVYCCPYY